MGRLIDADKLEYTCNSDECGMLTGCNHCQYNIITEDEIESTPTVEAIPKADYENRLKADMVAMLENLKKEMNSIKECEYQIYGKEHWNFVGKCQDVIQQKIDSLKAENELQESEDNKC